ncbi:MAG: hypothetical protein NC311_02140 [Muribaculaceae bacterium]|nr:hypothetical protein [Muribaculaceae bacterium]
MRTFILSTVIIIPVLAPYNLYASDVRVDCDGGYTYNTCAESNPSGAYTSGCPTFGVTNTVDRQKCATLNVKWWRGLGFYSCDTCVSGATIKVKDETISSCGVHYTYCECTTTCSTTSWVSLRTGYESRKYCNVCSQSTQYQCAAGYYGSSSNGTSGCTQCPTWTDVYTTSAKTTQVRGTSAAGATAITGCYVAAGTYYDTTGTLKTTGNCAYKS